MAHERHLDGESGCRFDWSQPSGVPVAAWWATVQKGHQESDMTEQLSNAPVSLCFRKFILASSWRTDDKFQRQDTKRINNQGNAAMVLKPEEDHLIKAGDGMEREEEREWERLKKWLLETINRGWGGFLGGASGKNPPANARDVRDVDLIPGMGGSPGGGHGNPLRYSCLEKLMNREAWRAMVYVATKCRARNRGWGQR